MKEEQIILDELKQRSLPKHSPAQLPIPHWLKEGEYTGRYWIVVDNNPASPKKPKLIRFDVVLTDPRRPGEICRLTDPKYTHLLGSVKQVIYGLRTGKHATITSAKYQEEIARFLIDLVQWMIMNGVRRFADLDREEFEAYAEEAIYGPGHLLLYSARLTDYVNELKKSGREIPSIKRSNKKPYLDAVGLLEAAGIDPQRGRSDKATKFELWKIAESEGFYLHPKVIARLSAGPPKPKKLSYPRVFMMLLPWNYLWLMRRELLDDSLTFNPFNDIAPDAIAKQLGGEVGRTKTAPVRQTMELIDLCLRWVLFYAPVLLSLRDQYDRLFAAGLDKDRRYHQMAEIISKTVIPEGPGRPFPLNSSTKSSPSEELNFGVAVLAFIPLACLVVIAAFTGRRLDEILSVQSAGKDTDDCLSRDEHGFWLETYIEKLQVWERTPCNEVVVAAVEVLRRWSASARAISGENCLFQYKRLTSDLVVRFNPMYALNQFVAFLALTPMPDGHQWGFKPHQFRRFFAIMYFWRYQFGDLTALSYHLRHLNPAVTKMYVTERESGAIFRYVNKDYTATILTEAALGERNISGPFGERFKAVVRQLRNRYRHSTVVVSQKLARKTVERFVEKSGRRLKGFRWGYCACGTKPQHLRVARCLEGTDKRGAVAPDLARSSFITCGDCPHHVTEPVFEPFWQGELEMHERAASDSRNGPILCETSRAHAAELRRLHQRSFESSKPLERLNGNPH